MYLQAITNDPNNLNGFAESDLAYANYECGANDYAVLNHISMTDTYPASQQTAATIEPGGYNSTADG
jgi:hypothetical protein